MKKERKRRRNKKKSAAQHMELTVFSGTKEAPYVHEVQRPQVHVSRPLCGHAEGPRLARITKRPVQQMACSRVLHARRARARDHTDKRDVGFKKKRKEKRKFFFFLSGDN